MNILEIQKRLESEPDFVNLKRFEYSLEKVVGRYPEGCPTRVIAQALMISEEEVEDLYQAAVVKLRMVMGVDE